MELALLIGAGLYLVWARSASPAKGSALQLVPLLLARNFLQNNPLNVQPNPDRNDPWRGQTGIDDRGLSVFATRADGMRAGAITILNKFIQQRPLTLMQFGELYAPAALNPPAEVGDYGRDLGSLMMLPPGDPYNAMTRTGLIRLLDGVIRNENGGDPLSSDELGAAADAALGHFNV